MLHLRVLHAPRCAIKVLPVYSDDTAVIPDWGRRVDVNIGLVELNVAVGVDVDFSEVLAVVWEREPEWERR